MSDATTEPTPTPARMTVPKTPYAYRGRRWVTPEGCPKRVSPDGGKTWFRLVYWDRQPKGTVGWTFKWSMWPIWLPTCDMVLMDGARAPVLQGYGHCALVAEANDADVSSEELLAASVIADVEGGQAVMKGNGKMPLYFRTGHWGVEPARLVLTDDHDHTPDYTPVLEKTREDRCGVCAVGAIVAIHGTAIRGTMSNHVIEAGAEALQVDRATVAGLSDGFENVPETGREYMSGLLSLPADHPFRSPAHEPGRSEVQRRALREHEGYLWGANVGYVLRDYTFQD